MALYKYVTSERIDVLLNLRVRFTQPFACNDPFEFKPLFEGIVSPESAKEHFQSELEHRLQERFRAIPLIPAALAANPQLAKEFSFLRNSLLREGLGLFSSTSKVIAEGALEEIGKQTGILSLSETATETLMWAHYSGNHSGFVIQFDETHPWFHQKRGQNDDLCELKPVRYVEKPSSPYLAEIGAEAFYSKLKEWKYEREWRVIRTLTQASEKKGQEIYLFDVPPSSITRIILGLRTSAETAQRIEEILRRLELQRVRISRMLSTRERKLRISD